MVEIPDWSRTARAFLVQRHDIQECGIRVDWDEVGKRFKEKENTTRQVCVQRSIRR